MARCEEDAMAGEGGGADRGARAQAWQEQVRAIVEELPFEDDPSAFVAVLEELAQAHALEEEE